MIAAAYVFLVALITSPEQIPRTSSANTTNRAEHQNGGTTPPAVRQKTTIGSQRANAPDREKPNSETDDIPAWVQAISAVVVAALTVALVHYSRKGWSVAKQAANAAELSANTGKRALETLERADVLVDRVEMSTSNLQLDTVFTVYLRNFGRSRANTLSYSCRLEVPPKNSGLPLWVCGDMPMILGAGSTTFAQFVSQVPLTAEIVGKINAAEEILQFSCLIDYVDEFGNPHNMRADGTYWAAQRRFRILHRQQ